MKTYSVPAKGRRRTPRKGRWLIWGLSATLILVLASMITIGALTTSDSDTGASASNGGSSPLSTAYDASTAARPATSAASDADVVDPPMPHEIAGMEVDANGDAVNKDMTGPGDDSAYLKDDDGNDGHGSNNKTASR